MATNDELLARIWIDPNRCFGKPCIRGTRIWVSLVLDLLASGMSLQEILEEYPGLTPLDIQACRQTYHSRDADIRRAYSQAARPGRNA